MRANGGARAIGSRAIAGAGRARGVAVSTLAFAFAFALVAAGCGGGSGAGVPIQGTVAAGAAAPRFAPTAPGAATAASSAGHGFVTARLLRPARLHARPGGPVLARLEPRTEFGSARVLAVVRRRGDWIGVTVAELPNGRLGWVSLRGVRLGSVQESLVVDLSRRLLELRRGHRALRRVRIAVGRPGSPTPVGRYAVTDKLNVAGTSVYGCCALALSGHQQRLPANWVGGDRLAIHATSNLASIGRAESLGCLRAGVGDMRALMRKVALGTPVFVRS